MLKQVQKVETNWKLDELDVLGLLPVQQVLEVVNKGWVLEVASLGQEVQVIRIAKTLNKFQLNLKNQGQIKRYVSRSRIWSIEPENESSVSLPVQ